MQNRGPLIIGGLGGSGTRVIADIAMAFGWYLGKDLNRSLDNRIFTLMFKRPDWYRQVYENPIAIESALNTYEWLMRGRWPRLRDWRVLFPAIIDMARHGPGHAGSYDRSFLKRIFMHLIWPWLRIARIYLGRPRIIQQWGWKEPNSYLYLPFLNSYFPKMRYIHVIRHGLDMVFSQNQAQFINWSSLYGIDPDVHGKKLKNNMLDFWIKANNHAIRQARTLLGDRFLLVKFDDLCNHPMQAVGEICAFLGGDCTKQQLSIIARIPVKPSTVGRHRRYAVDEFDPSLLEGVRQLGFPILEK